MTAGQVSIDVKSEPRVDDNEQKSSPDSVLDDSAANLWQYFLCDTIRSGLGLIAGEVWICSDGAAGRQLSREAHYTDPAFADGADALKDPPSRTMPGMGLAGVLWASAEGGDRALEWKPLSVLAKDEDLPEDLRTIALAGTFDLVCAVRLGGMAPAPLRIGTDTSQPSPQSPLSRRDGFGSATNAVTKGVINGVKPVFVEGFDTTPLGESHQPSAMMINNTEVMMPADVPGWTTFAEANHALECMGFREAKVAPNAPTSDICKAVTALVESHGIKLVDMTDAVPKGPNGNWSVLAAVSADINQASTAADNKGTAYVILRTRENSPAFLGGTIYGIAASRGGYAKAKQIMMKRTTPAALVIMNGKHMILPTCAVDGPSDVASHAMAAVLTGDDRVFQCGACGGTLLHFQGDGDCELDRYVVGECEHAFHPVCYERLQARGHSCPACRSAHGGTAFKLTAGGHGLSARVRRKSKEVMVAAATTAAKAATPRKLIRRASREKLVVATPTTAETMSPRASHSPGSAAQPVAAAPSQQSGLLILFARASAQTLVTNPANGTFLAAATQVGTALLALSAARAQAKKAKGKSGRHWAKLRFLVKTGFLQGAVQRGRQRISDSDVKLERKHSACLKALLSALARARAWSKTYFTKFRGVRGAKAPVIKGLKSRDAWVTFMWTWIGVFLTLLGLSAGSELVIFLTEGTYFLMLGSFGALMALHYGAPNSPLAQPRNTIFGCTLAATSSILFSYLGPNFADVLPSWFLIALAPATSIALCQRLNVLHPPAGAAALIFVSAPARITNLGWMYLVMPLLAGNVWCIVMAMLVNNAARDRQYPVFW